MATVSYNYVTSFNFDSKATKDVHLTCRCHMTNVICRNIFYENIDDTE